MRVAPFALAPSLALLLAPSVHAEVTPPRVISPAGLAVQEHAVGAGGGRTAVLMTGLRGTGRTMRGAVYARIGRSSTSLGPSIQLAARRGETPSVAVGADGTAVAAWVETGVGVRVAIAHPGRSFGTVRTVRPDESGGKADRPFRIGGVVVTPAGRAALVWRTGGTVQTAVASALGRFPRATAIGVARQHDPSIALGISGTVALGWLDTPRDPTPGGPPPGPATVQATMLREGASAFAPPTPLGSLGYWPAGALTGGGPGGAIIGWWENGALRASQLGISNGFGAAVTAPGSTVDGANTLGTDASGAMISVARTVTYAGGDDLETVTAAAVLAGVAEVGKPFGRLQQLSTSGWIAESPRVAAMPDRTFVAWEERQGTSQMRIRSAYRRPSGGWTILKAVGVTFPRDGRGIAVRVSGDAHQAPITWISYRGIRDPSIGGRLTMAEYRP